MATVRDYWQAVLRTRESIAFNETERRNELKALEMLYKSGYYSDET